MPGPANTPVKQDVISRLNISGDSRGYIVNRINIMTPENSKNSHKNSAKGRRVEKRARQHDRRRQTLKSVVYGGLYPRRANNRRPQDDQTFILDWYDEGLFMVAMGIIVMSCLDAFFTLNLLSMGAHEVNYFMKVLIEADTATFLAVKFTATASGVIFLVAYSRFRLAGILPVRRIIEALCAAYACLIIWELYLLVSIAFGLLG